ncbi:MAG: TonB family protein, partial [Undibacterium sp.]|nr:TonB family protein [Undibacterium sp.]
MDFNTLNHKAPSKLPSLIVTVAIHALVLGMALQATKMVIITPKSVVDHITPVVPKQTPPPIPEETITSKLPPPDQVFFPAPEVDIVTQPLVVPSMPFTNIPPLDGTFKPSGTATGNPGATELVSAKPAVHTAPGAVSSACEKPDYPANSARIGEEGTVSLAMLIGADGRVLESRIEKSSGSRALDKAAV